MQIIYNTRIYFIDSLNFLPFSLAKFPQTFDLENIAKGWYPHFFNTDENYNYVGKIPNKEMFALNGMSDLEKNEFDLWYEQHRNITYDNRQELIKYCSLDVEILRRGCTKFMIDFMKINKINPFLEGLTLAQVVMKSFRKNFLSSEELIGIVPINMYHANKRQSFIAMKWLIYINKSNNIKLEAVLCNSKIHVDGFDVKEQRVYEFLGCYYHGCPKCFLNRRASLNGGGETAEKRYNDTIHRMMLIENLGFNLTVMWECEFRSFLEDNTNINKNLDNDPLLLYNFLNPRDAVYGGRTEVFKQYHNTKHTPDQIRYVDFISLYPYINKYGKNPIGHPVVYRGVDCEKIKDICDVHGLIKCIILPPQDLILPVLPSKINNQLIFTLCRTCAELKSPHDRICAHDEFERSLIGTWVIAEIKLALDHGYTISETIEIWIYEVEQYNPELKTGGIFTSFVNEFLKIKQESSGWPAELETVQDKDNYVENYFAKEGVQLDKTKIKKNPSMRNIAKSCLNSLWGKFMQRNDRAKTCVVNTEKEFLDLVFSPGVEIIDLYYVSESQYWISWKYLHEDIRQPIKHVSVPIGAFTTANARIKLYCTMKPFAEQLLYCDTDSVVYVESTKNQQIKTGNALGDLQNELECYGRDAYITEFVSTGPKCYGYIVFDTVCKKIKEVIKCKGFTIRRDNREILNFDTLKNMTTDDADAGYRVIIDDKQIRRRKMFEIVSEKSSKILQFTSTKRVCNEYFKTVPYGYKKINK